MSYYLQIDAEDPSQLASNAGYGDLVCWVESLPAGQFPLLNTFCDQGWAESPAALAAELDAAISGHAPQEQSVRSTAEGMLSALREAPDGARVAGVTQGL